MATTVRRVKQEARLRRSAGGQPQPQSQHQAQDHVVQVFRMPPAEAEGYGPYKPVPPPKPLPPAGACSPPPYRQPPGPTPTPVLSPAPGLSALGPGLPGTATDISDLVGEPLSPSPRQLHTHSSKFPIEREVILSGTDKDSKIPILHEYKKRPKSASAIAPDAPSRSLAWIEERKGGPGMQHDADVRGPGHPMPASHHASHDALDTMGHQIYKAQPLHVTQEPANSTPQPRPLSYHPGTIGNHESIYGSTGSPAGVPRTWTTTESPTRSRQQIERQQQLQAQQRHQQQPPMSPAARQQQLQADMYAIMNDPATTPASTANSLAPASTPSEAINGNKESSNKAFPSRTYHSIKDLISSRFGSGKSGKDSLDVENALNNLPSGSGAQTPRYNGSGAPSGGEESQKTPTTPRQRPGPGQSGGRREDDYQHLPAGPGSAYRPRDLTRDLGEDPAQTPYRSGPAGQGAPISSGPMQRTYRYGDDENTNTPGRSTDPHGLYGTARYGATPNSTNSASPYQRVPLQHPEPIYQRYPADLNRTPTKQAPAPQTPQQQQKQPPPQQGSSNASVSSPQTLLREHGVYMVMRQNPGPVQGYGPGDSPRNRRGSVELVERPNSQAPSKPQDAAQAKPSEDPSKGVTYGGGLYQVVSEQNGARDLYQSEGKAGLRNGDPHEVYVDPEPSYGRTGKPAESAKPVQSRRGSQARLEEDDDDEGGFVSDRTRQSGRGDGVPSTNGGNCQSGTSSDYEKARQSDSGRGSTVYSSGTRSQAAERLDTSTEMSASPLQPVAYSHLPPHLTSQSSGSRPCEWVDMVESELRQILDNSHGHTTGANSTLSESISSMTPPLPPLSPGGSSPGASPRASRRYGHSQSLPYGSKPDYATLELTGKKGGHHGLSTSAKRSVGHVTASARSWRPGKQMDKGHKKKDQLQLSTKSGKLALSGSLGLDADLTSNTTGLDLDSVLDGATATEENNTSEEDEDMSTTVDASDTRAIRKQLEGLEGMYSEVLKLLGVRKQRARYQPSDPRVNKRRLYGSLSSLPSSVSSRPVRDRRRHDDRKKVKDIEGINKRFQRLESHVVTLARSVAHLSSEMRTQHLMIREMEHIRSEMANLRTQTNMMAARSQSQSVPRGLNQLLADRDPRRDRLRDPAAITNPSRVKKLTKFFGDEPPLLRLFLKKLGYEKYASAFEQERVGMVELPYLTEERLQKMGIPMGPRLRILQEAQISACRDTVYVV